MMSEDYPVNIKNVIASKSPSAAKHIPNWVIKLITKIVHVDKINYVINTYGHYDVHVFAQKILEYIGIEYEMIGIENMPDQRCIFASNHPLGGLDGLILLASLMNHCDKGAKLIVNDLLMFLEPLRPAFIPVNKHGKQSPEYRAKMEEAYKSENQIITFPAGLCSRLINGEITDLQWHRSFVLKAQQTDRMIVPLYFDGRNSKFFYRLAKLRKFLKIKFNIEMLFLPHEMFYPTSKHITIHIGKPIPVDEIKNMNPNEVVARVREECYKMSPQKNNH